MQTITFTCETITPMFLAGADGNTPELRPPSIKGALRFWWRAMNGHLDLKTLKEQESLIFGGTDSGQGRSKVLIRVEQHSKVQSALKTADSELVPHRGTKKKAFMVNQNFKISLSLTQEKVLNKNGTEIFNIDKMSALFQLTCILGGFGKRVRRGMGSVNIKSLKLNEKTYPYNIIESLQDIYKIITILSPYYTLQNSMIYQTYSGKMQAYGWVHTIELSKTEDLNVTNIVSKQTHDLHQKYGQSYDYSLGHAFKGRFASPIYVSILPSHGKQRAIVTTLNTISGNNNSFNPMIQIEFKKKIL